MYGAINYYQNRAPGPGKNSSSIGQLVFFPILIFSNNLNIWRKDEEIAIPLSHSGNGLGQYIKVLYLNISGSDQSSSLVCEWRQYVIHRPRVEEIYFYSHEPIILNLSVRDLYV